MSDPHAAPLEDEPRTPMWLPALGAALFVGAGLWWAVTPSPVPVVAEPVASASASAAPAPEAAPVASVASAAPVVTAASPPLPIVGAAPRPGARPPPGTFPHHSATDERLRRLGNQLRLKGAGAQP